MTEMPLPFAMPGGADAALAVEMCKTRFGSLPNGKPSSVEDLLSILVLTSEDAPDRDADPHIVGAKVQMGLLGLGTHLNLPVLDRLALYCLASFRLEGKRAMSIENRFRKEGVDLRASMRGLWSRTCSLYARVKGMRKHLEEQALQVERELKGVLPEGLSLMPHQLEAVARAREERYRFIFADDMGLGKMQPDDSLVLTPSGWNQIQCLSVGDFVIDPDGGHAPVTGVYPQGLKQQYRVVLSDGSSTECGLEHLWHVYTANDRTRGGKGRVLSLEEIIEKGIKSVRFRGGEPEFHRKWFLPITSPVEYESSIPLLLDPYLLGVLLGNGGIGHAVRLTNSDDFVVQKLKNKIPKGTHFVSRGADNEWGISKSRGMSSNNVTDALRSLGLFGLKSVDKFVPDSYLYSSVESRLSLLRGLMDTDGDCTEGGVSIFNSSSSLLRDAVIDVVRSLGGVASVSTREFPSYTYKGERKIGRPAYRVNVRLPFNPFSLPRKAERWRSPILARSIDSVEKSRIFPARCISVGSKRSLYITDDFIVTHNTISLLATMAIRGKDSFPVSISCPLALTTTWSEEVLKWLKNFDPKPVILSSKTDIQAELDKGENTVFIGSYSQMRIHGGTFQSVGLGTMICDESHYIANRETQRTRSSMLARTRAKSVLLATGTLMPNGRYAEAYSQLKMVKRDVFRHLVKGTDEDGRPRGDWYPYAQRFCGPKTMHLGPNKTVTQYKGRSNDVEFGILLGKYQIRRTKAEVFGVDGLPSKSRHKVWVPVSHRARLSFAKTRDSVRLNLQKKASGLQEELMAKGICDEEIHTQVKKILGSEAVTLLTKLRVEIGIAKAKWCVQRVKELLDEGHHVLVFCWHNAVASKVAEAFEKSKIDVTLATGRMSGKKRTDAVDDLKNRRTPVGVLTSAYREGLTLTGYDRIIMLERWWKPGDEMQAEDRIHRIGQTRDVAIEFPVVKGTYDEQIGDLQVWKEAGSLQSTGSAETRTYEWLMEESTC